MRVKLKKGFSFILIASTDDYSKAPAQKTKYDASIAQFRMKDFEKKTTFY